MSVSADLDPKRLPWVLDSDKICAVTTPLIVYIRGPQNSQRVKSEVMTTFFLKISIKCTNFEVSSLGILDEVSISSRNFNQVSVSVSVSKVTVSTKSLYSVVFKLDYIRVCSHNSATP